MVSARRYARRALARGDTISGDDRNFGYEIVQRNAKGAASSIQFMTKLEVGAADYAAILNPEHEKWNQYVPSTRRAIQTLIVLRMRPIRPIMLSISRSFETKEADKAFRLLVNLSVRFLIAGGARTGTVEQTLAATAQGISDGTITTAKQLLEALDKVVPKDPEFEEEFKVATVSQAYLARYYLRSLEMNVKKQPDPSFIPNDDQQVINLEHILPENPEDSWPEFTPEMAAAFYRRIGNMARLLARSNSDLKSVAFNKKR